MMSFFQTKKTRAVVNDDALVVSFGNANPPLVWRTDLMQHPAFSILTRKADADWELVFIGPAGVTSVVARFDVHVDAEQALCVVQTALLKVKEARTNRLFKVLIGLSALALLWFFVLGKVFVTHPVALGSASLTAPTVLGSGVPVSADAMLKLQELQQRAAALQQAVKSNTAQGAPAGTLQQATPVLKTPPADGVPQSADDMLKAPH